MPADIRREAEELIRYHSELARRIAQTGVRDIPALLALHEQLKRSLEALSRQEIAWAAEQAEKVIEALARLDADLDVLRRLKAAVDRPSAREPSADRGRRAS
jgi:glutamine synthetase type III